MKPLPLVGVVLAVPALWAGLTTWQIPGTVLEREVGAQILGLSGMTVTTQEAARFTLLPYPQMAVDGIRLAGAPENLSLEAATMRGKVRLLPLMGGRIELADLTLVRPVLSLAKSGFSDGALAPIGRLLAPSSEHQAPEMPDIRKLTVIDGSVSEPGPDGQTADGHVGHQRHRNAWRGAYERRRLAWLCAGVTKLSRSSPRGCIPRASRE